GQLVAAIRWLQLRRAILVFLLLAGHDISAGEPAVEVDVCAALGAERTELLQRRLGTDRAWACGARLILPRLHMGLRGTFSMRTILSENRFPLFGIMRVVSVTPR